MSFGLLIEKIHRQDYVLFMITRFLPWKFLIKRAARRYGIIDPLNLIARVRRFSQPSEIQEPIELLRAGIIFHARGLINSRVFQYNLDWVWPFWVERQFNPNDLSFIPRGFSFSHVNLTHRNWTAVGFPDVPVYPIIDPQGLFTPLYDGWSIDCWIITRDGKWFLPSRMNDARQEVKRDPGLSVETEMAENGFRLFSKAGMVHENGQYYASLEVEADSNEDAWLVVVLRPYNPEGIQFIENLEFQKNQVPFWLVNHHTKVYLDEQPEKVLFSNYHKGDVIRKWNQPEGALKNHCGVGLGTSAAFFPLSGKSLKVRVLTDLSRDLPSKFVNLKPMADPWQKLLENTARLQVPDTRIKEIYDTALQTLLLLSADDVVPGPYTYFRFWFRDACLMINSMLAVNLTDRAFRALDSFPRRQKFSGYFQSQQGEWDSNGQVLWIMERYLDATGKRPTRKWLDAINKGGLWIEKKRVRKRKGLRHEGLLPAGFSAEHLGPNDNYYWDDFWGVAGLWAASRINRKFGSIEVSEQFERYAADFEETILSSIEAISDYRSIGCIPASPYRRMDAGAIGSLVADYPLQLLPEGDTRIMNTIEYLMNKCFHDGAFFQDMIHSGLNAYLTLDIAQTLLRNGDVRFRQLFEKVIELASPTWQWPEAIHPLTGGGCMGDGQHGWAASEFLMMVRNMFVREESGKLVIGAGIFPEWINNGHTLLFGPGATPFGPVTVSVTKSDFGVKVIFENEWRSDPPEIDIRIAGYRNIVLTGKTESRLELEIEPV